MSTPSSLHQQNTESLRPPYGKRLVDLPRASACSPASVNPEGGYFGKRCHWRGRRFWPVACDAMISPTIEREPRPVCGPKPEMRFRAVILVAGQRTNLEVLAAEQQADRYQ